MKKSYIVSEDVMKETNGNTSRRDNDSFRDDARKHCDDNDGGVTRGRGDE